MSNMEIFCFLNTTCRWLPVCVDDGGGDDVGGGRGDRVNGGSRRRHPPPFPLWSKTAAAGTSLVERSD